MTKDNAAPQFLTESARFAEMAQVKAFADITFQPAP